MWFVLHVKPGAEEQAVELLKAAPKSDLLEEVFCSMCACQRKDYGELTDDLRPMIDGAVFVAAPGKRELRACTRQMPGLDALYDGHPSYEVMEAGEEEFLNLWAPSDERICDMSAGRIDKGGYLHLENGPLVGHEDAIAKISRNRRWVFMETPIAGKLVRARFAVRITENEHLHPSQR